MSYGKVLATGEDLLAFEAAFSRFALGIERLGGDVNSGKPK
jgi:hypothetical protein